MRSNANLESISPEDVMTYFDLQYGTKHIEQLENLYKEFGELSSEIMADHRFVNQGFIYTWNEIANQAIDECTEFDLTDCALFRLPQNIGRLIQLEILSLRNNVLKILPDFLAQFNQLNRLFLLENTDLKLSPELKAQLESSGIIIT